MALGETRPEAEEDPGEQLTQEQHWRLLLLLDGDYRLPGLSHVVDELFQLIQQREALSPSISSRRSGTR